jgi:hypothetical protein
VDGVNGWADNHNIGISKSAQNEVVNEYFRWSGTLCEGPDPV